MSGLDQQLPEGLIAEVKAQSSSAVSPDFSAFVETLKSQYGESIDAIILYGSCLHTCDLDEGIADLYIIVDQYQNAYSKRYLSYLNAWLAPNVFYIEVPHQGKTLRAKYAVISTADFERGAKYWFHSYIWARFAQPSRLLYARDAENQLRMHCVMAHSVMTFLRSGIPALGACTVDAEELWTRCLMLTYAAELRPENETRARHLAQRNLDNFRKLTHNACPALTDIVAIQDDDQFQCLGNPSRQRATLWRWRLRRWQGRVLSILRLSKATLTFQNAVDYAAWKIERHTGVRVEITPLLRRHPILWGLKIGWRLLRRGLVR